VYRRSRLPLLILFALTVSACIGGGTPAAAEPSAVPTPSSSASPSGSPSVAPTAAPAATPLPTASPSREPSPSASPGDGLASVEGCTGKDENRAFFAKAAGALRWPVYCAALPARWFLSAASYTGASGGKLESSYNGPNGARLELREGAFCAASDGCVSVGQDAGSAMFGDQTATLVHLDDGRVAAVVARGERLSWLVIGDGLDDAAFQSITAALIRLD
jgi:hypothetical protein